MNSHTIPQKLLVQFAYYHALTKSPRLWRYEKGMRPYPKACLKNATAFECYFVDPDNPTKENEIETRLAYEFENPVHRFLSDIGNPSFALTDTQRRQMTLYLTLLFWRSEAIRKSRKHYQNVTLQAIRQFLSNEVQILTVTSKWNIDLFLKGRPEHFLKTKERIVRTVKNLQKNYQTERNRQKSYLVTIERWMAYFDDAIYRGQWGFLKTSADNPFIISDAPVITWERNGAGILSYGIGFRSPNVEVFLPLSPLVCLHIMPNVDRTCPVKQPTVREVNIAQAAFAHKYCFTNIESTQIDEIMQRNFGRAETGIKAFTVWHIDYSNAVYELLMNFKNG
jgi:hypothetical protein